MKQMIVAFGLSMLAGALPLIAGCGEGGSDGSGPTLSGGPPPPAGGPGGGGPGFPEIKRIMSKLAKGPNSLTPVLGKELKEEPPPWETIQGQAKDYAEEAANLGKHDPPKGAKESWRTLTAAFAESAADLDQAAKAKDKSAATQAHDELRQSCNACHRQHRGGGPGRGGPPPGFGPPGGPGGPPPGGPGGPPHEGPPPK